ncbi:MAG TPA: hypothetical protein VFS67_18535 [Polyangiaceae bacterium]|jgi:hypothetical protein|nr:hypothetical protein [Polyangiaceae bacterium]
MRSVAMCLALVLLSCESARELDDTEACIADHPPGVPFDVGDVVVASPPPGSNLPEPAPPSAADIAQECALSGGAGCDPEAFISKAAASCIATLHEFSPGVEPWQIALTYHHGHERVVWNVMNQTAADGSDGYGGEVLTIDATEGEVLETSAYRAVP